MSIQFNQFPTGCWTNKASVHIDRRITATGFDDFWVSAVGKTLEIILPLWELDPLGEFPWQKVRDAWLENMRQVTASGPFGEGAELKPHMTFKLPFPDRISGKFEEWQRYEVNIAIGQELSNNTESFALDVAVKAKNDPYCAEIAIVRIALSNREVPTVLGAT